MSSVNWYAVAMGGNLGDVFKTFEDAIDKVNRDYGKVTDVSKIYLSKPLPTKDNVKQDSYLNGLFLVESNLLPEDFLNSLLKIEESLGRDRKNSTYWGPRTIDLDIVCSSHGVIDLENLKIPHPRMCDRDFVLLPLFDVMPEWTCPISGKKLIYMIENLGERFIERVLVGTVKK